MITRLSYSSVMPWHHWPVTGSTLYRRLPDGTWAAEREDPASGAPAAAAGPVTVAAASAGATPASESAAAAAHVVTAAPPGLSAQAPVTAPTIVRRRRRPVRTALLAVGAVVLLYLGWLVGLALYAGANLDDSAQLSANPIADTPGKVWLLVGSDSREGLSKKERKELHTGKDEGSQRTDTIMLVHQQAGQEPTLISVPRDSWVTIPAHTAADGSEVGAQQAKINAAYAYGGSALLAETIEYNTGLHVDNYMEVGMGGIVDLTDAVGGVEVCFDEAITDENSGLDVDAGCQTLDGATALAWVRMRYADPKGDLGRMERQQQWVRLMIDQMTSPLTLLNPVKQWQLVNTTLDAIVVDQGSGALDLGRLGLGLRKIVGGSGEIASVPVDESDNWESGQWVLHWDPVAADELFASIGGSTPQVRSE